VFKLLLNCKLLFAPRKVFEMTTCILLALAYEDVFFLWLLGLAAEV